MHSRLCRRWSRHRSPSTRLRYNTRHSHVLKTKTVRLLTRRRSRLPRVRLCSNRWTNAVLLFASWTSERRDCNRSDIPYSLTFSACSSGSATCPLTGRRSTATGRYDTHGLILSLRLMLCHWLRDLQVLSFAASLGLAEARYLERVHNLSAKLIDLYLMDESPIPEVGSLHGCSHSLSVITGPGWQLPSLGQGSPLQDERFLGLR